jgi:hypothetical protein
MVANLPDAAGTVGGEGAARGKDEEGGENDLLHGGLILLDDG